MALRDDLSFVSRGVLTQGQEGGAAPVAIALPIHINLNRPGTLEVALTAQAIEVAIHG